MEAREPGPTPALVRLEFIARGGRGLLVTPDDPQGARDVDEPGWLDGGPRHRGISARLRAPAAGAARPGGRGLAVVALAVGNVFLLSPVLLDDLGLAPGSASAPDKLAVFAVPASVLWLALWQMALRDLGRAHALLLPFYVVVGVDLFLIGNYGTRLSSSMIAVLLENSSDAGAYLREHRGTITIAFLAVGGLWGLIVLALRDARLTAARPTRVFLGCSLVALYGALVVRQVTVHGNALSGVADVVSHDRNSPFGVVSQGLVAAAVHAEVQAHRAAVSSLRFGAVRAGPPVPTTIVLVLGESARPDRWGLYDARRATTPRLVQRQQAGELIVFEDVVTQAALTQLAVPLLLTRGPIDELDALLAHKSVISAVAEAGYRTAWLSTQQRDHWTGAVNLYSAEAQTQRFFDRRHDDVLVDALREQLDELGPDDSGFLVLHTQGSHFTFTDRYPADRAVFATDGEGLDDHARMLNAYDNTVAFTDAVLADVIDALEARGGEAALVYVADHGENLRDDDRGLFGHFIGNEFDLRVPMFVWASSTFVAQHPDKLAAARANAHRPVSTRAIFATMLDAASVVVDDVPVLESVLQPRYRPGTRKALRGWAPIDVDAALPPLVRRSAVADVGRPPRGPFVPSGAGDDAPSTR